ncbi:MAG: hypothetical protein Q9170_005210 [Blastenia crenularia]
MISSLYPVTPHIDPDDRIFDSSSDSTSPSASDTEIQEEDTTAARQQLLSELQQNLDEVRASVLELTQRTPHARSASQVSSLTSQINAITRRLTTLRRQNIPHLQEISATQIMSSPPQNRNGHSSSSRYHGLGHEMEVENTLTLADEALQQRPARLTHEESEAPGSMRIPEGWSNEHQSSNLTMYNRYIQRRREAETPTSLPNPFAFSNHQYLSGPANQFPNPQLNSHRPPRLIRRRPRELASATQPSGPYLSPRDAPEPPSYNATGSGQSEGAVNGSLPSHQITASQHAWMTRADRYSIGPQPWLESPVPPLARSSYESLVDENATLGRSVEGYYQGFQLWRNRFEGERAARRQAVQPQQPSLDNDTTRPEPLAEAAMMLLNLQTGQKRPAKSVRPTSGQLGAKESAPLVKTLMLWVARYRREDGVASVQYYAGA